MKRSRGAAGISEGQAAAVELAARQFLMSRNSGCLFARNFAMGDAGPIDFMIAGGGFDGIYGELDAAFDDSAFDSHAAVVLFPEVETVEHLLALLAALVKGDRWTLRQVAWKEHPTADILIGIDWRTSKAKISSVMGLAPFLSTPIYRRAPHAGLVVWPGEHENEHWPVRNKAKVGLVHMRTNYDAAKHKATKDESAEFTAALRSLRGSYAAQPDVAFCLPAMTHARLVNECGMTPL